MYRGSAAGGFRLRKSHMSIASLAAIASMAVFSSSAMADVDKVTGSAFGVDVDVTLVGGINVNVGPTPTVTMTSPPGGLGPFTQSLASVNASPVLTAGLLQVRTEGGNLGSHSGFAQSSASVANVNVGAGALTASLISSQCKSNGDGSTGSSSLANVNTGPALGNISIPVNAAPNTVINVPGVGSITVNEQIRPTNGPGDTSIIVRAIHIRLLGGPLQTIGTGDIIISESRCGAKGPDVVPVAPIGLLGVTAMLGIGFAGMQWKKRRNDPSVAASTL
jgi:hypothetical protein